PWPGPRSPPARTASSSRSTTTRRRRSPTGRRASTRSSSTRSWASCASSPPCWGGRSPSPAGPPAKDGTGPPRPRPSVPLQRADSIRGAELLQGSVGHRERVPMVAQVHLAGGPALGGPQDLLDVEEPRDAVGYRRHLHAQVELDDDEHQEREAVL